MPRPPEWDPRSAVGVVLAAAAIPAINRKGESDRSWPPRSRRCGRHIFHAGTTEQTAGDRTAGGRAVRDGASATRLPGAGRAHALAEKIRWTGMFHRHDIGYRAIARERRDV